ncbi:hypothetical protein X798_01675 [Onchocerca flexuosa]|uniref:Cadherin domain protein n=2 Tax=Onchocerca flexuosa TaxID=387005 RepID=A0A238C1B7_9BILA|nr:hypothetical protein X798_01675 [Onchocerca flexuosa]
MTFQVELLVEGEENSINNYHSYYEFTINEGIPVGSIVGRIGSEEKFKFELLNKNDNYEIDKEDGVIRTKNEVRISKLITVLIIVAQANSNIQFCPRNRIDLVVPENSPSGTFVGILKMDRPESENNRIHYTLQGHPDAISINSNTGMISTTAPFDFEIENLYQFKAFAHRMQDALMECSVFLYIIDRNDNVPKFGSSNYEVEVYEDTPTGQVILQLEVEDWDFVNEFVYEISAIGNERSWFGIKPDGRIFLTAPLDREHMAVHQLHITVYDQRPPERGEQLIRTTTTVKVIVLDVNDNTPRFVSSPAFFISDGLASGAIIGLVQAVDSDMDLNGQLQYRILPWSNPEGLFMIDPVLGYLLTHDHIVVEEREDYHLLIEARDYGIVKRLSTIVPVTVTILGSNKKSPRLRNFYHIKIPENVSVGHTVCRIINGTVTNVLFEIESGNEDKDFRISSTNGTITTKRRLNAAKKSNYNLTVSMRLSNNTRKQSSIVLIEILNVIVKTPRFLGNVDGIFYVGENMQGPYPVTIGELKVIGTDLGFNGMLSYSLVQGNNTLFRVVPQTGELQITESLDYEVQNQYELIVQATDLTLPRRSSRRSTVIVEVLNVNDNAPVFEQPQYYVEVMENEAIGENSTVLCLKVTDEDDREFSMIRYSLEDADLLPFFINSTTGCIERLEILDRESQSQWILKVTAHDNGKFVERSSTAIVRIRVLDENDNIPIILNEQLDVFIPNNVKEGNVVYVLSANDLDEDDFLYYNLSGPDVSYFQINQSGIIIAVRELIKQDYSITATVSDHGNLNSSVGLGFYISETMKFPIFEKRSQSEFVVTEHDPNILITKFIAQSVNVSSRGILFSIFSGDPNHHFYLNPNSGELYTTSRVDYEYRKQYELWIAAIDQHTQPMVSYANCIVNVVDINDNKPFFDKVFYSASVAENGDSDELVTKVVARDSDSGMNGEISYSLTADESDAWKYFKINEESGEIFTVSALDAEYSKEYNLHVIAKDHGNPQLSNTVVVKVTSYDADMNSTLFYYLEGDYADSFLIDQQTGWISLAKEVDREKKNEYSIKVKAWDGLWEVRTSLTITVEDINDNPPTFNDSSYKFLVAANSKIFTEIGQILAFDVDEGLNGQVRYELRCDSDLFMVEPTNGHIFSITSLKEYVNNTMECKGLASDQGFPSLNSNVTIYIHITDATENNETKQHYYEFALLPDIDPPTVVGQLPFHNTIAVVNDSRFMMDEGGHLITNATFSEAKLGDKIIFSIVTNNTNDPIKAIITIEFTEPNIHRPEFSFKRYKFSVQENCRLHMPVGVVMAKDPDIGLNGRVTYRIINDVELLPFTIDPIKGTVLTTRHLDFEETNSFHFLITATDSGFPIFNDTAKVTVEVLDENDNGPEFENHYVQYTISANLPLNATIAHLSAVDIDSEPNARIVYHLLPDSAAELPFAINATSGVLYVSSELLYETTNEYLFRVLASNTRTANLEYLKLVPESSQNGTYSDILLVEIFVHSDGESEIYFPETERNFEISASALKREIYVKKTWNGTTGTIMVQIVATSQLSRNPNFKPNLCKVYIELKDTEAPPILLSHYKFSLPEDADSTESFVIFEHFPQKKKYRLDIVEEGTGSDTQQPFCIGDPGKLRLCDPVNYKQRDDYRLQIALIQDNVIRSRAQVTIIVNNVNDKGMSLNPAASIGYIFAINDNTGVVSSLKVLDREKRSLYVVPVMVSDLDIPSRVATVYLRIYVDDQDDNAPVLEPRIINLGYLREIPDVISMHAFPVDADQVGTYSCRLLNDSQTYNMSDNCMLKLSRNLLEADYFLNTPLLVEASNRHTNITFPTNLRMRRDTSPESMLNDFGVIVELWGIEWSIANSISAFEEAFPHLVLQLLGLQQLEIDLFRVFIAILDRHLVPTDRVDALKLLKQFFAEKFVSNVHVKQIALDMCTLTPEQCMYGAKCSQNITKNGELFELIGYRTSFIVPVVISHINCICENDMLCDVDVNRLCDENEKCHNGGTCERSTGTCLCAKGYTGKFCKNDVDECEDKNICGNGKCLNTFGSFVCACDDNEAKILAHCNNSNNNICDNCQRGKCVKQNNGQHLCECDEGYSGRYCHLKIRCFDGFSSSLQFPFHQQIFKLTQGFRTLNPFGLLLGSFATAAFKGPHFTLALRNGQIHLSANSNEKKNELFVEEKVNDGNWKMIRFRYKHRTVKLTIEHCDEDGFCEPCQSIRCIAVANNFDIPTSTGEQFAYIGGMNNSISSSVITKQIGTENFEGCMRQIVINEHDIDKGFGFLEQNIVDKDNWKTCADGSDFDVCSGGICVVDENDKKCICIDGFDALNCHKAIEPWHVKNGGIIFQLSMYMMQKLELAKNNISMKMSSRKYRRSIIDDEEKQLREIPCEESEIEGDILNDIPAQWMELDFKTALSNTVIFAIVEENGFSKIELINGSAYMIAKMKDTHPIEVYIASNLDDIDWHRLSIQISEDQKLFRIEIDGHGKEIRSEEQLPTLISSSLLSLSLGHNTVNYATAFSGCFRRFIVNNQAQNLDVLEGNQLSQQIFKNVGQKGARKGCDQFLMKRAVISLEWKMLIFIGLIFILFFISIFAVILWLVRKHQSPDSIVKERRKCWKPKLSKLLSLMRSSSKTRHIDDSNDVTIQRAVYCGPNILQNNESEIQNFQDSLPCDSNNSIQLQEPWADNVHDLDANTLYSNNSRDCIYQNLNLLSSQDKSNTTESTESGSSNVKQLNAALRESHVFVFNPQRQSFSECNMQISTSHQYIKSSLQTTDVIGKDSSESEIDSTTACQTSHILVLFHLPHAIFADSEDSSADGSQNFA